jgi:hypothetical protein
MKRTMVVILALAIFILGDFVLARTIIRLPDEPSVVSVTPSTLDRLTAGFDRAFRDPAAFEETRLFQVLGYTAEQIAQINRVTPFPASLTVECTPASATADRFASVRVICRDVKYY